MKGLLAALAISESNLESVQVATMLAQLPRVIESKTGEIDERVVADKLVTGFAVDHRGNDLIGVIIANELQSPSAELYEQCHEPVAGDRAARDGDEHT